MLQNLKKRLSLFTSGTSSMKVRGQKWSEADTEKSDNIRRPSEGGRVSVKPSFFKGKSQVQQSSNVVRKELPTSFNRNHIVITRQSSSAAVGVHLPGSNRPPKRRVSAYTSLPFSNRLFSSDCKHHTTFPDPHYTPDEFVSHATTAHVNHINRVISRKNTLRKKQVRFPIHKFSPEICYNVELDKGFIKIKENQKKSKPVQQFHLLEIANVKYAHEDSTQVNLVFMNTSGLIHTKVDSAEYTHMVNFDFASPESAQAFLMMLFTAIENHASSIRYHLDSALLEHKKTCLPNSDLSTVQLESGFPAKHIFCMLRRRILLLQLCAPPNDIAIIDALTDFANWNKYVGDYQEFENLKSQANSLLYRKLQPDAPVLERLRRDFMEYLREYKQE